MTLAEILEGVKTMTREEREQLRAALGTLDSAAEARGAAEDLERRLFDAGLLRKIKQPITDLAPYRDRQPIEYRGKPLSEVIIEERG